MSSIRKRIDGHVLTPDEYIRFHFDKDKVSVVASENTESYVILTLNKASYEKFIRSECERLKIKG